MAKLKTFQTGVRVIDHRRIKPAEKRADHELLTPEHRTWAHEVKRRAGYRCEAIDSGVRCPVKAPARLFADHIVERSDGGPRLDIANGQCLCGSHHTRKTAAARAARLAARPAG